MAKARKASNTIAFQGEPGANSDMACRAAFPYMTTLPCPTFETAMGAVQAGKAELAIIPVENSIAGRVADLHSLLPHTRLKIVAEHFQRVEHCLVALPGASLKSIKTVKSHVQALSQCRNFLKKHRFAPLVHADTAGAAREIAEIGDPSVGAIASSLAARIYDLKVLAKNIEDADHNTTRMLVFSRDEATLDWRTVQCMTAFLFRVKSVPAALYKALGGFATNGVNIVKLESYLSGAHFEQARVLCRGRGSSRAARPAAGARGARLLLRGVQAARHLSGPSLPAQGLGSADASRHLRRSMPQQPVRIAPSILSADFAALGQEIEAVTAAGADWIHVDVMDNHFVPNLTIGPMVVKALRKHSAKPFDVHLMVTPVDPLVPAFAEAGADTISFHPEAGPHRIARSSSSRAWARGQACVLNPATPLAAVEQVLGDLDLVLVMSVNPGFGGQAFIESQLAKIAALRKTIDALGKQIDLEVDGGVNPETAKRCIAAGADALVAGTAVFTGGPGRYAANIKALRS